MTGASPVMSIEAIRWALREAPGVPAQCLGVLIGLAEHADKHGRASYPSAITLSVYARKSERQARTDLALLTEAKLIRPGDQSLVAYLPQNRRPVVYDLALEMVCDLQSTAPRGKPRGGPANRKSEVQPTADMQPTAPQQSTAPQTAPDLQEHEGVQPTAPQVPDLLGCSGASAGVQPAADKPSMNQKQKLKDVAKTQPPLGDGSALFDAEPSPNGSRKTGKRGPNPRQVLADEITDSWWDAYKTTTAQSYISVRNIVRTAVVNGLAPDVVAQALGHLGTEGRSISGGTIQNALHELGLLGKSRHRGGASDDLSQEDYTPGGTIL